MTAIINATEKASRRSGDNGFGLAEIAGEAGIQKSSIVYLPPPLEDCYIKS